MGWKDKIKILILGYRATSASYRSFEKDWSKDR